MNFQQLERDIKRIAELGQIIQEATQEIMALTGESTEGSDNPSGKRRRVVYPQPLEKYVVEALSAGPESCLGFEEIYNRVRAATKTTVLKKTIYNTVLRLGRNGIIENMGEGKLRIKPTPAQTSLEDQLSAQSAV